MSSFDLSQIWPAILCMDQITPALFLAKDTWVNKSKNFLQMLMPWGESSWAASHITPCMTWMLLSPLPCSLYLTLYSLHYWQARTEKFKMSVACWPWCRLAVGRMAPPLKSAPCLFFNTLTTQPVNSQVGFTIALPFIRLIVRPARVQLWNWHQDWKAASASPIILCISLIDLFASWPCFTLKQNPQTSAEHSSIWQYPANAITLIHQLWAAVYVWTTLFLNCPYYLPLLPPFMTL